jgi:hypothetical protein
LDGIDLTIWILPILAILDVVSTFYVESYGYPLILYEGGLFASYFARAGLIYFYAVVYVLIVVGFAYVLWYIKNRVLDSSKAADKAIFILLILGIAYMYMELTASFIGNFFIPHLYPERGIQFSSFIALVYMGAALSLFFFLYADVARWWRGVPKK